MANDTRRSNALQRKHVLAKLDRLERENFLAKHMKWSPDDSAANQAVWQAAVFNLPEEMDEANSRLG